MLIIVIKKPSGEDERVELAPGEDLPPIEEGDHVVVQNPDGDQIDVQVKNGDLILVVKEGPEGGDGETQTIILKGMAEALDGEGVSMSLDLPGREAPLEIRSLEQIREIGLQALEIPDAAEDAEEDIPAIEDLSLEQIAEETGIEVAAGPEEGPLPEAVAEPIPDAIAEAVPEALPEAVAEALPAPAPEAAPDLAPPAPISISTPGQFGDDLTSQQGLSGPTSDNALLDPAPLTPPPPPVPVRPVVVTRDDDPSNTPPPAEPEPTTPVTPVFPDIIIDPSRSVSADGQRDANGSLLYSTIEEGLRAAETGHEIYLEEGTYNLSSTLNLDKEVSVTGASETGVVLDASAHNGYGILINADNVSLSKVTLSGANHYGIKIQPDSLDSTDSVTGTSLTSVTVKESARSGIDLNGADQASLSDISVSGSSTGVGIAMTDSSDISLSNIATSGNGWGGVAIYTAGRYYEGGSNNISFSGSISTSESVGIYQQTADNLYDVTNLNLPEGCDYKLTNADFRAGGDEFTFFFADLTDALVFGEMLTNPDSSVLSYTNPDSGAVTSYSFQTGGNSDDTLAASSLGTALFGGDGADTLTGSAADDILLGGNGDDLLTGGLGADRFILSATDTGSDTILDFETSDHLDLSDLLDNGTTDFLFLDDGAGNARISAQTDPDAILLTLNNVDADNLQMDAEGMVSLTA